MTKIKMTLIGLLAMLTFVVAPAIGGEQMGMEGQEGHIRISELMDKEVHDQQGNELGSVKDLIVNREGEVEFLIVSEDEGVLGLGEQELRPIPWDMVEAREYTEEDDAIRVAVDQETFQEAPSFTDDQWETFTRGDMDQEVRGYYGENGRHEMMQQPGEQERDDAWGEDQEDEDDDALGN